MTSRLNRWGLEELGMSDTDDCPENRHIGPLDVAICDDVMACLDALRWAKQDVHTLVPQGEARTLAVLDQYGIEWPKQG